MAWCPYVGNLPPFYGPHPLWEVWITTYRNTEQRRFAKDPTADGSTTVARVSRIRANHKTDKQTTNKRHSTRLLVACLSVVCCGFCVLLPLPALLLPQEGRNLPDLTVGDG